MTLFVDGPFTAHSGAVLPFKIDCDALTIEDIETLAGVGSRLLARHKVTFGRVVGIPTGGIRFAEAMTRYETMGSEAALIVDDVLTTGGSMAKMREDVGHPCHCLVIFARRTRPAWVHAIFQMNAA